MKHLAALPACAGFLIGVSSEMYFEDVAVDKKVAALRSGSRNS